MMGLTCHPLSSLILSPFSLPILSPLAGRIEQASAHDLRPISHYSGHHPPTVVSSTFPSSQTPPPSPIGTGHGLCCVGLRDPHHHCRRRPNLVRCLPSWLPLAVSPWSHSPSTPQHAPSSAASRTVPARGSPSSL
jgi:hypothetical protein